jgi:membrane protease YdiL (CAAX protease family)
MKAHAVFPHTEARFVSGRSRRSAAIEIAAAYGLILAVEWTPRPWQRVLWLAAAMGVALIVWRSFDGWQAMGLRAANLGRSLWIAAAALLLAGAAIVTAVCMHTLLTFGGPFRFFATYCAYALWSGVQQLLLQGVFLPRFLRLIPKPAGAALVAAVLFALAHLPNPVLVPITFLWGFAACLLFLRYRNIYPLMIAHAILGITVAITIPGPVDHNMRVGLGYLRYDPHKYGLRMGPLAKP